MSETANALGLAEVAKLAPTSSRDRCGRCLIRLTAIAHHRRSQASAIRSSSARSAVIRSVSVSDDPELKSDHRHRCLLRASKERPGDHHAAEECHEIPSFHTTSTDLRLGQTIRCRMPAIKQLLHCKVSRARCRLREACNPNPMGNRALSFVACSFNSGHVGDLLGHGS